MKFAVILLFLQLSPAAETQKYQEIDEVLNKTYNHSRQLSADKEAEAMARILLEKYPDDPYVYNLWASLEWLLIGRELNLRADEQKDIREVNGYKERVQRYRDTVNNGLTLTENTKDERSLFLRSALKFDHAKFSARYESKYSGLKRADKEAGEGIQILREILKANPSFCSAYLFLGGNRLQLSTKTSLYQRPFIWGFSGVYSEIYSINTDVFNEQKSIEWLEISYRCHYSHPWMKKGWLETNFLLIGAYRDYGKKLNPRDEIPVLKKEVPLLKQLTAMFPQNQDIAKMLSERELRLKTLENYFSKR
ncbi:MAG: hypothetical protein G01um101444_236 [Parcubacteria group bacterium Gr01-1014_44]|nr:MAG: hypothetical protein G01um101444_236 [Parcubacteria group bacterium Gr01-1014_44]